MYCFLVWKAKKAILTATIKTTRNDSFKISSCLTYPNDITGNNGVQITKVPL